MAIDPNHAAQIYMVSSPRSGRHAGRERSAKLNYLNRQRTSIDVRNVRISGTRGTASARSMNGLEYRCLDAMILTGLRSNEAISAH
jgi:hypothetical protein